MSGACVVVTGAASGMGLAVARGLLAAGETVLAVDLNQAVLSAAFPSGQQVVCVACDLSGDAGFEALTGTLRAHSLCVKGFVHCAGFVRTAPLGYILSDDARQMFDIHALFPMRFLGWLTKKANRAESVSCVLISSMACHEGDRGNVAYAAAKGAVEGMLRGAAAELVGKAVRVNALVLGVVDTPLAHKAWMDRSTPEQIAEKALAYPLGFGQPDDVAAIVQFFLSPASRWVTGQTLVCDGGHSLM